MVRAGQPAEAETGASDGTGAALARLRLLGFEVLVRAGWLGTYLGFTAIVGGGGAREFPSLSTGERWLTAALLNLWLLPSMIAHELAHALVARRAGIPVERIELDFLIAAVHGGREKRRPSEEFWIALAGPMVNVAAAALFAATALVLDLPRSHPLGGALRVLVVTEAALAGTNPGARLWSRWRQGAPRRAVGADR